jgi:hypothetical protein
MVKEQICPYGADLCYTMIRVIDFILVMLMFCIYNNVMFAVGVGCGRAVGECRSDRVGQGKFQKKRKFFDFAKFHLIILQTL